MTDQGAIAIGDWLRRMGAGNRQEQLRSVNDRLVRRYLERDLYLEGDLEQGVEKRDAEKRESGGGVEGTDVTDV